MGESSKRSTVYFDPQLHAALRLKAAHSDRSLSDIVNEAVRAALAEDQADLSAFEERVSEPTIGYNELLDDLKALGTNTSAVEVTNISTHGVWLLVHERELFMPYDRFPWFLDQPVRAILNVEEPTPGHFYWPELDVDLTETIIEHPERFPNVAGSS